MAENLEQEMKELIAGVIGREPEELKPDTNFWKDLGVDSIKAIEITVAIERHFKVSVRDEQIPKIATVGDAITLVKEALEKKQKG
ncbi:MAG: acyl carrier protein [Candidatus Omnitrophica bacterium]|nr:acyl carrier protein [Candidatus Omnitrophota bacterium]